jgi:ADP-dependent phosphofructokinase/glucokinase
VTLSPINTTKELLLDLCVRLETIKRAENEFHVLTGFDGFVDRIQKAVKKKESGKNAYFKTIKTFSEHLGLLAEKSGQVELITERIKMGGNAPLMANALANLGIKNTCIGSMGFPALHPVFNAMPVYSNVISISDPGLSQAIEFEDGKIILSELNIFDQYDWNYIRNKVDIEKLRNLAGKSHLVAFLDWVNLPHASDIWEGFLEDVIKPLDKKDIIFFFDLCDPSKKSVQQIDEVLDLISSFSACGKVILGLNENETNKIWLAINGYNRTTPERQNDIPSLKATGASLFNTLSIDILLIHPIDRTLVFTKQGMLELEGYVVKEPKVQTGGGDNLNAGYCLGLLLGFDTPKCMLLGMAASGSYVQQGCSPGIDDLTDYIKAWAEKISRKEASAQEAL